MSYISSVCNAGILSNRFIGKTELKPQAEQNNATEVDNEKTWAAHSRLQVFGRREYHGLPLRCVSEHPMSAIPAATETRIEIYCMCNMPIYTLKRKNLLYRLKFPTKLKFS